jgi:hypothetical protein
MDEAERRGEMLLAAESVLSEVSTRAEIAAYKRHYLADWHAHFIARDLDAFPELWLDSDEERDRRGSG